MTTYELQKLASQLRIQHYQSYYKFELINKIREVSNVTHLKLDKPCAITEDEAFVMGLFFADGTCGVYKWQVTVKNKDRPRAYTYIRTNIAWHIDNANKELLEKCRDILIDLYGLDFKIVKCSTDKCENSVSEMFRLLVNGGNKTIDFVQKYRRLCYENDDYIIKAEGRKRYMKQIHDEILNAPLSIRDQFFKGYYAGDGRHAPEAPMTIDIESKITAQSVYILTKSLGYEVSMNTSMAKPNVITINLTKGFQQDNPCRIKKIFDLGVTEQYVYDLETENHHFHAGVGQMIVHNTDGHHIKGLIINMFHSLWPSLVTAKGFQFVCSMMTPIVKAFKARDQLSFYSITDFENWREQTDGARGWNIKYYKGLGTSTEDEAKEYFRQMRAIDYTWTSSGDAKQPSPSEQALDLAFNKARADDRKEWLSHYDRKLILDYNNSKVTYEDFINKELIHFSNYDIERSIPSVCDGLKTSQRKILYCCFKKPLWDKEIRVAQLAAYVSENSAYHHGEASLQGAIIAMAQDFVGANNINLLLPNGQFGSRVEANGKDAASPRYIHTQLSPITAKLFVKDDTEILNYLDDDGFPVEPEHYIPIIPLILVNGALGIGTGFSTNIPSYNPLDIISYLRKLLDTPTHDTPDLTPWYRGFTGSIEKQNNKWVSRGAFKRIAPTKVEITELPVGFWTSDFKTMIETMICDKEKYKDCPIKSYESHYTPRTVNFVLHFTTAQTLDNWIDTTDQNGYTKLENELKLVSTKNLSISNMYAFNERGQITKYNTAIDIIKAFYNIRLAYYVKRKEHLLSKLGNDINKLNNKIRFIMDVINNVIIVHKLKKAELEARLVELNYDLYEDSYDYLTKIPIYNFTVDKVQELQDEIAKKNALLTTLNDTTPQQMWSRDLDDLEATYDQMGLATITEDAADKATGAGAGPSKRAVKTKPKAAAAAKPKLSIKKKD